MIALFYEDHRVGQTAVVGACEFTREAIIAFARAYDPQPFHLDDAAGAASRFGSLCASGWHTACVGMRALIDYREAQRAAAAARGEPLPPLGVRRHPRYALGQPGAARRRRHVLGADRGDARDQAAAMGPDLQPRDRRRSARARGSVLSVPRPSRPPRPLTRPRDPGDFAGGQP